MTSLLPPNASPFERAMEQAIRRLAEVPTPIEQLWNAETCPVELLPYLAWALSIDTWSPDWPERVKRARIRAAIPVQRMKGTAASVRSVVAALGGAVALREWWELSPPAEPHTFELILSLADIDGAAPSAAYVDGVIDDVSRTKPARSHFTFTLALQARGGVAIVGAARPAVYARLPLVAPAA